MSDLRGALSRIYEGTGALTPQSVVDDARPSESDLHSRFEWDDALAGEAYRRTQAAQLIRSVRVEYTPPGATERKYVRAWSSVRETIDPEHAGYQPTEEIATNPLAAKILLRECERAAADLKRKYGHLADFIAIMQAQIEEAAS